MTPHDPTYGPAAAAGAGALVGPFTLAGFHAPVGMVGETVVCVSHGEPPHCHVLFLGLTFCFRQGSSTAMGGLPDYFRRILHYKQAPRRSKYSVQQRKPRRESGHVRGAEAGVVVVSDGFSIRLLANLAPLCAAKPGGTPHLPFAAFTQSLFSLVRWRPPLFFPFLFRSCVVCSAEVCCAVYVWTARSMT